MKLPKIPHLSLLIGPTVLCYAGIAINAIVMGLNHGQMPVQWPGGCTDFPQDFYHSCMTHATHLKFLCDWIAIKGLGIASPADMLIWGGEYLTAPAFLVWLTLVIKDHQANA